MLIQALGCSFQNEATITAAIQMPLDLTFYARRELPFQVPTSQMDRIPTGHRSPAFSGPAWVGPFSSRRGCDKIWRKALRIPRVTPGKVRQGYIFPQHASVLLRYGPWLLAAGRVQLISRACSDLLHKFLHIERKSILHKAHRQFLHWECCRDLEDRIVKLALV